MAGMKAKNASGPTKDAEEERKDPVLVEKEQSSTPKKQKIIQQKNTKIWLND